MALPMQSNPGVHLGRRQLFLLNVVDALSRARSEREGTEISRASLSDDGRFH